MKTSLITAIILYFIFPIVATAALYEGPEAKKCFEKNNYPEQQERCLTEKKQESTKQLDTLINETDKKIRANNIGPLNGEENARQTSGDVYSEQFLKAQRHWREYRQALCLAVATEIGEEAWDYHAYIDQCEINLNKRHAEEIRLMGLVSNG